MEGSYPGIGGNQNTPAIALPKHGDELNIDRAHHGTEYEKAQ
jgi:hypothetical protein